MNTLEASSSVPEGATFGGVVLEVEGLGEWLEALIAGWSLGHEGVPSELVQDLSVLYTAS